MQGAAYGLDTARTDPPPSIRNGRSTGRSAPKVAGQCLLTSAASSAGADERDCLQCWGLWAGGIRLKFELFEFFFGDGMRGWVYVISNRSMPGLVKIGYTLKNPDLRAAELNHTGVPHPYVVDYEVMVDQPRNIEQKAHSKLKHKRAGKEWFRCSPETAIATIQGLIGNGAVTENFKRSDRAKATEIRRQDERKKEAKAKADLEKRKREAERNAIRQRYNDRLRAIREDRNNWLIYGASSLAGLVIVTSAFPKASDMAAIAMIVIFAWFLGGIIKSRLATKAENSPDYLALVRCRDEEIAALDGRVSTFGNPLSGVHVRSSPEVATTSGGSIISTPCRSSSSSTHCPYCSETVNFPGGDVPHSVHCPRCYKTFFTR